MQPDETPTATAAVSPTTAQHDTPLQPDETPTGAATGAVSLATPHLQFAAALHPAEAPRAIAATGAVSPAVAATLQLLVHNPVGVSSPSATPETARCTSAGMAAYTIINNEVESSTLATMSAGCTAGSKEAQSAPAPICEPTQLLHSVLGSSACRLLYQQESTSMQHIAADWSCVQLDLQGPGKSSLQVLKNAGNNLQS